MPHALFLFSPVFFNDFLAFTAPSNFELLVSRLVDAAVQTASSLFLLHLKSLRQLHPVFMGAKVWILASTGVWSDASSTVDIFLTTLSLVFA